MFTKEKNSVVKATKEGRLYITTEDFFQQPRIKETIERLVNSDLVKSIDNYNYNRTKSSK